MPIETLSIDLSPEIANQIRDAIHSGEYESSSEIVEDALREWALLRDISVHDIEGLRKAWDEVRQDDSPAKPAMEVLDRLEQKYRALAESQGAPRG
jgi:antitoxin ParD1/3/4